MSVAVAKAKTNGNGKQEFERLSISALGQRFDLDRATVRKRLFEAAIAPIEERAKEKLYELTPRLYALLDQTDTKLTAAKLQKELANAEMAEIKVAEAKGELLPTAEVTDIVQRLFGANYKETARMIKRWAPRVAKIKTAAEAEKLMMTDFQRFQNSLRADCEKFLPKNGNCKK